MCAFLKQLQGRTLCAPAICSTLFYSSSFSFSLISGAKSPPGILWPKFEDQAVGQKLAISGSIKDDILNITELAMKLADYMKKNYPGTMASRYGIEESDDSVKVLADIAIAKCCLMKGGEPNIDKAASMLIDDFRSLRLGKVTLEQPPRSEEE